MKSDNAKKGVSNMPEKEKKILEALKEAIPKMTEKQRDFILGYAAATNDIHARDRMKEEQKVTA